MRIGEVSRRTGVSIRSLRYYEQKRLLAVQMRQIMIGRRWSSIIHIFYACLPALVYYVGGRQVFGGTLSLGSPVAYTMLQYSLFTPVGNLLDTQVALQKAMALFERIFEYLDLPVEITDRSDAISLDTVSGHIRFRSVHFRYHPEHPTLKDVDFQVQPGSSSLWWDPVALARLP